MWRKKNVSSISSTDLRRAVAEELRHVAEEKT